MDKIILEIVANPDDCLVKIGDTIYKGVPFAAIRDIDDKIPQIGIKKDGKLESFIFEKQDKKEVQKEEV